MKRALSLAHLHSRVESRAALPLSRMHNSSRRRGNFNCIAIRPYNRRGEMKRFGASRPREKRRVGGSSTFRVGRICPLTLSIEFELGRLTYSRRRVIRHNFLSYPSTISSAMSGVFDRRTASCLAARNSQLSMIQLECC